KGPGCHRGRARSRRVGPSARPRLGYLGCVLSWPRARPDTIADAVTARPLPQIAGKLLLACYAGFPGPLLAGYAAVKGHWSNPEQARTGGHSPGHVPGRDLERQLLRVAPEVLIA